MRIGAVGRELEAALLALECTPPPGSVLYRLAREVRGMASAYHSDGSAFFERGDPINALAAYSYALGWIGGGIHLGLVSLEGQLVPPRFSERMPDVLQPRLEEKTLRYCSLLKRGLLALDCAAEHDTAFYGAALHFIRVAEGMVVAGDGHHSSGDAENALACYSYGFAWLDAGVRTGLFRVLQDRDLFTI